MAFHTAFLCQHCTKTSVMKAEITRFYPQNLTLLGRFFDPLELNEIPYGVRVFDAILRKSKMRI